MSDIVEVLNQWATAGELPPPYIQKDVLKCASDYIIALRQDIARLEGYRMSALTDADVNGGSSRRARG